MAQYSEINVPEYNFYVNDSVIYTIKDVISDSCNCTNGTYTFTIDTQLNHSGLYDKLSRLSNKYFYINRIPYKKNMETGEISRQVDIFICEDFSMNSRVTTKEMGKYVFIFRNCKKLEQ